MVLLTVGAVVFSAAPCLAQLGSVAGAVRDPQGVAVPGVVVRAAAVSGHFQAEAVTDAQGRYAISGLEPGQYRITVTLDGFKTAVVELLIAARQPATADIRLELGRVSESVAVTIRSEAVLPTRSETLITRNDLQHVPGALAVGSYAALLETTPSTVVNHDLIHVRGGHQVGFEVDGVPVPINSVGTNLALLFDPKSLNALEFQRGSYPASVGDRTYGVFNVITRSGFERAKGGEAVLIGGEQGTVDMAVAYGDHTNKFAYFVQGSGNRTDFGLTPPAPTAVHDLHTGGGAAAKLWMLGGPADMTTVTASFRTDAYQIPIDPTTESSGAQQDERDGFINALWTHTLSATSALLVAPYYHFSRVALNPSADGGALASADSRRIQYAGAKIDWTGASGIHAVQVGTNTYGSFLADTFTLPLAGIGTGVLADQVHLTGLNVGVYAQDRLMLRQGVTIDAGLRWDHTDANGSESLIQPRLGLSVRVPHTGLTAHAYAGRLFQPPPLAELGVAGSDAAAEAGQAFTAVHAERNALYEAGVTLATHGIIADVTYYYNHSHNFLDHEQLGDSAMFLPVNIAEARMRGIEVSISSPAGRTLRGRVTYAFGYAEGKGEITGGLGDIGPRADESNSYFPLDHDQRHAGSVSLDIAPPRAPWWGHAAVRYESGFLMGAGPGHLPAHATLDVSVGWRLARQLQVAVEGQNVTNEAYVINLGSEFNGTHYGRPRYLSVRVIVDFGGRPDRP